jgi:hypothetical protein
MRIIPIYVKPNASQTAKASNIMAYSRNESTIDRIELMLHRLGYSHAHTQLVGSNFMSHAVSLKDNNLWAITAYREVGNQKIWFTFTFKKRARQFCNQTQHRDEAAARLHHDEMVDTGDFYHPDSINVWWDTQQKQDAARFRAARRERLKA